MKYIYLLIIKKGREIEEERICCGGRFFLYSSDSESSAFNLDILSLRRSIALESRFFMNSKKAAFSSLVGGSHRKPNGPCPNQ
jgi:hypothetical protein